jgi:signal transduction histidine kinase
MEGKTWNSRQRRQKKSGEIVEMDLTVSPVHDDKGRIVNFVSVVRDVTRETALNQQIAQSQKLEAIGTLAGGIAHDLKNIFTPIVLNTEIALMDIDTDHPAYPLLEEIQEAARLGSDLTKQIVTFSRRSLKEKAPLPITPIIEESLSFLRSTLPSTITIHSRLRAGRAHVLADPTQIKQVMINLGNNAGHAMREQGGELYIELTREILGAKTASEISPDLSPGHYVRIVVRDTGEGMDEKTMQRIFDPFFTTKAKSEGTGMGLSVVHGIVRDHRGAITVRSTPGKGSSFTVFLPRLKSPGGRRRLTSDSPRRG